MYLWLALSRTRWGATDPTEGAYSAPQTPNCMDLGEKEGKGKGREREGGKEGEWKGGEGKEERSPTFILQFNHWL